MKAGGAVLALAGAAMVAIPAYAAGGDMSVATFLAKAECDGLMDRVFPVISEE